MEAVARSGRRAAETKTAQVERHGSFRWMARAGIAGRGVIYVILAIFAADIALHGNSPEPASGTGAIAEVARQPAGPVLVAILVVGLGSYGAWRAIEALSGYERPGKRQNLWVRIGWLAIAGVYMTLCVRAIVLLTTGARIGSAGSSRHVQAWAGRVLVWPAGRVLLGAAAVGVLIGAIALATWGVAHRYKKELCLDRLPPGACKVPQILGASGNVARGFMIGLVGVYLLDAAVDGRATKVKTVDLALESLAHEGFGTVVIGLLAAGLLCFAIYSLAEAWLRDL
jgi:hypothetical protein